jgi:hypothetical protein
MRKCLRRQTRSRRSRSSRGPRDGGQRGRPVAPGRPSPCSRRRQPLVKLQASRWRAARRRNGRSGPRGRKKLATRFSITNPAAGAGRRTNPPRTSVGIISPRLTGRTQSPGPAEAGPGPNTTRGRKIVVASDSRRTPSAGAAARMKPPPTSKVASCPLSRNRATMGAAVVESAAALSRGGRVEAPSSQCRSRPSPLKARVPFAVSRQRPCQPGSRPRPRDRSFLSEGR